MHFAEEILYLIIGYHAHNTWHMPHLTFLRFDKPQNQAFLSSRPEVFDMSLCTYNESSVKAAFEEFNINLLSCQEKVYTD